MGCTCVIILALLLIGGKCYDLTILHTNDVHSRIDEAHKYGGICSDKQSAEGDCVGGSARLYTKIEETRNAKDNVLLLDGGDQFQGTFWFHVYKGLASAQFMRKLGYNAMALGNHEFDNGLVDLQDFINNVTQSGGFEVLSSNIDNANEPGLTGYLPHTTVTVGNRKVGIIGYTTTDTPQLTKVGSVGRLEFNEIIQSVRTAVSQIQQQDSSVNIIIALGHAGFNIDKQIAKEVEGVDIVVGGHSNTFLWTGDDKPAAESPEGDYPYVVKKANGKTALCVQAFTFTKYLGNLTVTFDDAGDVTDWSGNPILLDSSVPKHPEIVTMLAPYKERIDAEGDKAIARAVVRLDSKCRAGECNFGNFVGDAWIHSNVVYGTEIRWARASIALINGGSIRAPIERGNITNAQLLTSMPFGNDIASITVSGKTLKEALEHGTSALDNTDMSGRFPQVSGVQVVFDMSKPMGERVVELRVRCLECDVPTFEPLDFDASYTILTSSFLAGGGDGYTMLANERLGYENLGLSDVAMVEDYMSTLSSVYPAVTGRITFLTANDDNKCPNVNNVVSSAYVTKSQIGLLGAIGVVLYFIV